MSCSVRYDEFSDTLQKFNEHVVDVGAICDAAGDYLGAAEASLEEERRLSEDGDGSGTGSSKRELSENKRYVPPVAATHHTSYFKSAHNPDVTHSASTTAFRYLVKPDTHIPAWPPAAPEQQQQQQQPSSSKSNHLSRKTKDEVEKHSDFLRAHHKEKAARSTNSITEP